MRPKRSAATRPQRRRFLGVVGGLAAGLLALPWVRPGQASRLSLKEAKFQRSHDLEG